MNSRKVLINLFLIGTLSTYGAHVMAVTADYPSRPISIVVPFPPGSISDVTSRIIAAKMAQKLGQPVVIENKAGAGGIVGAQFVSRAAADGYTILLGTNSTNAINPSMYRSLPYDPARDFRSITMTGTIPALLVAKKDLAANNIEEVIALSRQRPGQIRIAVGTTTSTVASEILQKEGKFTAITVPYRGEPPGLTDLIGGQVELMLLNLPTALAQLNSKTIKAIGLIGEDKVSFAENIPLISQTLAKYIIPTGWNALFAPAKTPDSIVQKINEVATSVLNDKEVRKKLEAAGGYIVAPSTPEELDRRVKFDSRRWSDLIKQAGVPKI
ncbi:Bug family tripartite tricarboxylate transporter substrate binding protein [Advenella kashmirensis]